VEGKRLEIDKSIKKQQNGDQGDKKKENVFF